MKMSLKIFNSPRVVDAESDKGASLHNRACIQLQGFWKADCACGLGIALTFNRKGNVKT